MRQSLAKYLRKCAQYQTKGLPDVRYQDEQGHIKLHVDCTRKKYKELKKNARFWGVTVINQLQKTSQNL